MADKNFLNTANVLRHLPRHLRSKQTERVSKIKNASEPMATVNDFCQFLSEQAHLATDPIYSEETVARSKDGDVNFRRPGNQRFRREKVRASVQMCQNQKEAQGSLFPLAVPCISNHMF